MDKPSGPTSHDAVARIRKVSGLRRVGHAGTLDPFASGLLLLLVGSATRLSEYLLGLEKEYEATARLGVETSTHDPEGEILGVSHGWASLTEEAIREAVATFRGTQLQEPPRYSAKKVGGEAAHRRVRRGEDVVLKPVEVTIHEIGLVSYRPPELRFRVRCSSGTYVRALARDLGRVLGVGAHLTGLRRTGIGGFSLEEAAPLAAILDEAEVRRRLISPAAALGHLPAIEISAAEAVRIRHGQALPTDRREPPGEVPVRILLEGELIAVGAVSGGRLCPRKVLDHG